MSATFVFRAPAITGYDGKYDRIIEDENTCLVEWSPGDATRYLLVATRIGPVQARVLGFSPETRAAVVSVGTNGTDWVTVVMAEQCIAHEVYLAEKMQRFNMNDYTRRMYTALINMVLGDEAYGMGLAAEQLAERNPK